MVAGPIRTQSIDAATSIKTYARLIGKSPPPGIVRPLSVGLVIEM